MLLLLWTMPDSGFTYTVEKNENSIKTEIFFGLSNSKGPITEKDWHRFIKKEFFESINMGATILNGNGYWLDDQKKLSAEKSKVVIIIHDGSEKNNKAIDIIIKKYIENFKQYSVLRTDSKITTQMYLAK